MDDEVWVVKFEKKDNSWLIVFKKEEDAVRFAEEEQKADSELFASVHREQVF